MIYQWKSGSRIKADPNEAFKVMDDLAKENNLNAESLVEASRPEDAPLHDEFDWDDAVAAKEWRKAQARNIINAIVTIEEDVVDAEPVRCFFNVESQSSNYESINVILKYEDKTALLRIKALNELIAFRRKYDILMKKIEAESTLIDIQRKLESMAV